MLEGETLTSVDTTQGKSHLANQLNSIPSTSYNDVVADSNQLIDSINKKTRRHSSHRRRSERATSESSDYFNPSSSKSSKRHRRKSHKDSVIGNY